MQRTAANRLVLYRWFRDQMLEHGVRPSHIAAIKPIAIELFFIRTREECLAAQVAASEFAEARAEKFAESHHRQHWLWGRFGGVKPLVEA